MADEITCNARKQMRPEWDGKTRKQKQLIILDRFCISMKTGKGWAATLLTFIPAAGMKKRNKALNTCSASIHIIGSLAVFASLKIVILLPI